MAVVTSEVLKSYFQKNDFPTEAQCVDLIDTLFSMESGGGGDLSVKISLTANQIKTLFSLPITAVASPGEGKIIVVTKAVFQYTSNTESFDGLGSISIITDGASLGGGAHQMGTNGSVFSWESNPGNSIGSFELNNNSTLNMFIDNAALLLSGYGDSTFGDGTVDVYISYKIIDL